MLTFDSMMGGHRLRQSCSGSRDRTCSKSRRKPINYQIVTDPKTGRLRLKVRKQSTGHKA